MPDWFVPLLNALGNVSGWALAVAVLLFFVVALYKGWIVPGYIYQREVTRGDRAEDAVTSATNSTKQASDATKAATETALAVAQQLARLERAVARLQDESD